MSWRYFFAHPNRFNVLSPTTSFRFFHLIVAASLMLLTAAIYFVSKAIRKPIRPRLIGFELARPSSALHILNKWGEKGKVPARKAILSDLLFLPVFAALTGYLCFWAAISVPKQPWLAWIGVLLGWATLMALVSGWAEDWAMLITIARGQGTKSVFLTRFFASLKYGILAIAAAFLLCRLEYFFYEELEPAAMMYPVTTLAWLAVASALALMRVLQLAKTLHPSLLMFQLAPSKDAANRVLARWGSKRRGDAQRANRFDILFAILYTETLASVFFHLRSGKWPILASLPQSVGFFHFAVRLGNWAKPASLSWCIGWCLLLAGTCNVAQDCGAWVALREGEMGWWFQICRRLGALRVLLLFLAGLWGGFLVFLWEVRQLSLVLRGIH